MKKCKQCNTEITTGKASKIYCSDKCRANYHAKTQNESKTARRLIDYRLGKNWRILFDLFKTNNTRIHKEVLELKEFSFNFFTQLKETKNGNLYRYCYDYGYLHIDNDEVIIVKQDIDEYL